MQYITSFQALTSPPDTAVYHRERKENVLITTWLFFATVLAKIIGCFLSNME